MKLDLNNLTMMEQASLEMAGLPAEPPADLIYKIYRVEQSNGYDDVLAVHYVNLVVLHQRGKEPVRLEQKHAESLSTLMEECHKHRERTQHLTGVPDTAHLSFAHLGRDNGNFGDWRIVVLNRDYHDNIEGSHHLDEMVQALRGT
jgi:hypothetical protein